MPIPVNLIASLAGEAHLFHPAKGQEIARVLTTGDRAGVDWETGAADFLAENEVKPYRVQDGLAIIPIRGSLMHQWQSMRPYSGATGYDGIRTSLIAALGDDDVSGIMLDINSPGGMVSGCAECADIIHEADKPVAAYVDAMAYSAAYWLASQADVIVSTPTGGVGSIGALMMHVDRSGQADEAGLNITIIHSGSHKIDGNPYEPLPDNVKAEIQSRLDGVRSDFAGAVARGRGDRFTAEQAMATEAGDFTASEAMTMGMIDAIARPDQAISTISALLGITQETAGMAEPETGGNAPNDEAMKAEIAAQVRAEMQAERDAMIAEARAKIEREQAIHAMDAPKAMKDEFLSEAFAGVPVDALTKIVAAAPKSLADQADEIGGAGVEPDPAAELPKSDEAAAKAKSEAAAEALRNRKEGVLG